MDNKQKRTLDAVSRLDDDIINRHTEKRAHLLLGVKKRRFTKRLWISVGSAAAALLLVLSSLFVLIPLLSKQVPIYTGMSVAGENTALGLVSATHTVQYADPGNTNNNGNHYGWYKGDSTDREDVSDDMLEAPIESTLSVTGGAKSLYTARPGEDVYITIHIDNPDSFEILSFTLGGQKYSSYMFEPGSDMENIIIKVNVGDAQGIVDYTIDAIKYVDGEKIKDVRMEGDRTVQVGVAAKTQPTTSVAEERISFNSIRLGLTNTDELGLIAMTGGKLTAVLYDGNEIIEEKEISTETAVSVTFEGLSPNRVYQYAVVAHYDAFDGNGMADHVLLKKTFRTASPVLFDDVTVGVSTLSFSYTWDTNTTDKTVSAAIYTNGTKVRDIGTDTAVSGLLPATAYTLVAQYTLNGKTEQISLEFTTEQLFYTVRYLLSPLTGTEYILESEQSIALMPGDTFAPAVKTIEGFTAPAAQTLTVSTEDEVRVIEYRYTRNSYNVSFNVNGTTTVRSLPYGSALADAEHPSHTFVGWQDASGNRYTTVPAKGITLYAVFEGELTADDLLFSGSGEITITGLRNTAFTNLVIPAYINGGKVVAIGDSAFKNATYLTSVTLPSTLVRVGIGAFGGCTELTSVTFDGTLAEWCNITFAEDANVSATTVNGHTVYPAARYASNPIVYARALYLSAAPTVNVLAGELTLPTGTLTGANCFAGAPTTTLAIPEGVTAMPARVLTGLYDLETLRFNATNMPDLTDREPYRMLGAGVNGDGVAIEIGATVTRIPANRPFSGAKIKSITFAAGSVCTEIGAYAFTTGCLDGLSMNYITELVLPDGLLTIGERAIYAKNVTTLTIPASVTAISTNAFGGMRELETLTYNCNATITQGFESYAHVFPDLGVNTENGTTVIFGAGVTSVPAGLFGTQTEGITYTCNVSKIVFAQNSVCTEIAAGAFRNCATLSAVVLPATDVTIGEGAFEGCTALADLSLPVAKFELPVLFGQTSPAVTSVTLLGNGTLPASAFENWTSLTSVTLPEGITAIGENAFKGCSALEAISIPRTVTRIGVDAFIGCSQLKTVRISDLAAWCGITFETETDTSFPVSSPFYAGRGDLYLGDTMITDLVIPAGVTSIAAHTFFGCRSILSASIPEGVTHIDSRAFGGCSNLTSITLPSTLEEIGYCAIAATGITSISLPTSLRVIADAALCENFYLTSIAVPEGVTSIGARAFRMCAIESATLPSTLQALGVSAFEECEKLAAIEIPAGITTLNASTFKNCSSLASVTLPSALTNIAASAFSGCTALAEIDIPATVSFFGGAAFENCSALESISIPAGATINFNIFRGCTSLTALTLPDASRTLSSLFGETPTHLKSVTILGGTSVLNNAFYGCTGLTSITLPSTAETIGNYAFRDCTSLTGITLPSALINLGSQAFYGCENLTAIVLPDTLQAVGNYAFQKCTQLSSVTFGQALTSIGTSAFNQTALTTASLPSTLTSIGDNAFAGTPLQAIVLPANLEYLGANAFRGCASLSAIEIPGKVTALNGHTFAGCTSLVSVTLPQTLTAIGTCEFQDCPLVTLVIPGNVTSLGSKPLQGCTALTALTLPNAGTLLSALFGATPTHLTSITILGGTSVAAGAFYGCTGLTSITLPASVTTIGNNAFKGCTNVTALTLPHAGNSLSSLFGATPTHVTSVTILGGESVVASAFYGCTGLANVELPTTVKAIDASAFKGCTTLAGLQIPAGVTSIGNSAFENCKLFTEIALPATVKTIGSSAFRGCSALASIQIPVGVTSIGSSAFENCTLFTEIALPASVTTIGNNAFKGCTNVAALTLPNASKTLSVLFGATPTHVTSVTVLGGTSVVASAFYGCTGLASVQIPTGVTSIGDSAFSGCTALAGIQIPTSVTSIGNFAFWGCTTLASIQIPTGVMTLGESAFGDCTALASVTLPNTVTKISASTFSRCTSLTQIDLPYGITTIGEYAFANSGLTQLTLPDSVTELGEYFMVGCPLVSLVIPPSITNLNDLLGGGLFDAIDTIKHLTIPNTNNSLIDLYGASPTTCEDNCAIEHLTLRGGTGTFHIDNYFPTLTTLTFRDCDAKVSGIDYCPNLTTITIGEGITEAGSFTDLPNLTTLTLPEGLTYLGGVADCPKLTGFALPSSLTGVGILMHHEEITLPDGLTSFGAIHFPGKLLLGSSNVSLSDYTYYGATEIIVADMSSRTLGELFGSPSAGESFTGSVTILGGESIKADAFRACKLKSITLSNTITAIDDNAFADCTKLTDVYFDGTEEEWNAIDFGSGNSRLTSATIHFAE